MVGPLTPFYEEHHILVARLCEFDNMHLVDRLKI